MDLGVIKRDVATQGYSSIPFPIPHSQFKIAAEAYIKYLAHTPKRYKTALNSLLAPPINNSDKNGEKTEIGYRRKSAKEGGDDKEYFHFHPILQEVFDTRKNPLLRNFFEHAQPLYETCVETLEEILASFETEFPGIREKFFHENPLDNQFYLRFLAYKPTGESETLARGHYDRSGFTLALAESAPGLRIGKKGYQKEIVHEDRTTLIMPGMLFGEITNKADFPPSWHDVIRKEQFVDEDTSRWSTVFFADVPSVISPTPEETHRYAS